MSKARKAPWNIGPWEAKKNGIHFTRNENAVFPEWIVTKNGFIVYERLREHEAKFLLESILQDADAAREEKP